MPRRPKSTDVLTAPVWVAPPRSPVAWPGMPCTASHRASHRGCTGRCRNPRTDSLPRRAPRCRTRGRSSRRALEYPCFKIALSARLGREHDRCQLVEQERLPDHLAARRLEDGARGRALRVAGDENDPGGGPPFFL